MLVISTLLIHHIEYYSYSSFTMCYVINDTKYNEDACFIFRKLNNQDDDYSLSVMGLFNIHLLGVGDEIGLYWDPRFQTFMFIILSKVCRKKIFSVNNDLIETLLESCGFHL